MDPEDSDTGQGRDSQDTGDPQASPPAQTRISGTTCGGGLWQRLVEAAAEAAADGDVVGRVGALTALISQLLLPPPLCSSVGEPNLSHHAGRIVKGGADTTRSPIATLNAEAPTGT